MLSTWKRAELAHKMRVTIPNAQITDLVPHQTFLKVCCLLIQARQSSIGLGLTAGLADARRLGRHQV